MSVNCIQTIPSVLAGVTKSHKPGEGTKPHRGRHGFRLKPLKLGEYQVLHSLTLKQPMDPDSTHLENEEKLDQVPCTSSRNKDPGTNAWVLIWLRPLPAERLGESSLNSQVSVSSSAKWN